MSREQVHLNEVARHIKRGEQIPNDLMNSAINEITDTSFSKRERIAASHISASAGKHLESWALLNFISAKYSEEELNAIIGTRKRLVSRLAIVLPSIIDIFQLTDIHDISSAINQIYDCARDYPVIEKSQFSSQQRKKAVRGINSIIQLAEQLDEVLDQASRHVDSEFNHHKGAIARFYETEQELRHIENLRRELMALCFASRLTLYRDSVGERSFYVGDNKAKTHVVECAYRLALQFGAPALKTTPGSNFSNLCGLILELATGIPHESLAGAINKFARSPERREIDEEEKIYCYENSDEGMEEYESDNFSSVKARIRSLEAEEAFWQNMLSSQPWDEKSIQQISIRMLDVVQQKQTAMKEHGPFIVWVSQMSHTTLDEWRQESERHENKMLSLAVELGQRVRNRAD
ncbi:hypothetical protein [Neorhizobium galegae]|uniref:Uncharacterized protein n=1 Tax=Neorhizobium galegae bv. officinalis TaxID=323656 RepID=A0A0T7GNL5_NEOGA|nr:hypothetical protein [Neorhizobium galegae]CDZ48816.1 Hypothetical protein NGAL_HAMBI1189_26190 [Neorhizobium galegae bv. officinalis]